MSHYTTGEIAKLCGVSVRTVQYYDNRGILTPSQLSEGGRRLYSNDDLSKMRIICFLREMGFSIDNIGTLFSDPDSEEVINLLIDDQTLPLEKELRDCEEKLHKLRELKKNLKNFEHISPDSFGDIAHMMKNQKKLKRTRLVMLVVGIIMDIIEVATIVYGAQTGNWIPLLVGLPIVVGLGIFISLYYFRRCAYICPHCHNVFKPTFGKALWAAHTPNTRRLTCPGCGKKSFCIETYGKGDVENA